MAVYVTSDLHGFSIEEFKRLWRPSALARTIGFIS